MKCYLKETENGDILLVEIPNQIDEIFEIETHPIHKNIWIDNYMGQIIEEETHFRLSEDMIDEDTFQLTAYPIIEYK